ncbi:MAG: hypothetical protein ABJ251_17380 [Paracoccaceae bacterium]
MFNIDDITGWKEDIAANRKANKGNVFIPKAFFVGRGMPKPIPKLPFEVPAKIAEIVLNDSELRQVFSDLEAWARLVDVAQNSGKSDPCVPENRDAFRRIQIDFIKWCALQIDAPVEVGMLEGCVSFLVDKVFDEQISSPSSLEARAAVEGCVYGKFFGDQKNTKGDSISRS